MKSITKRIKMLEEILNVSELPSYKEFMNDFEDRYDNVDLNEILNREKIPFNIFVIHDLINKDEKIKLLKEKGRLEDYETIGSINSGLK